MEVFLRVSEYILEQKPPKVQRRHQRVSGQDSSDVMGWPPQQAGIRKATQNGGLNSVGMMPRSHPTVVGCNSKQQHFKQDLMLTENKALLREAHWQAARSQHAG